jgi:hypothetical protein
MREIPPPKKVPTNQKKSSDARYGSILEKDHESVISEPEAKRGNGDDDDRED